MAREPALDAADLRPLRDRAVRTLVGNWRGHSTVPSAGLYPHQWSWDSAFVACGLSRWAQRRAQTELASLFGAQWRDGRVPHIVFAPGVPEEAYFPGAGMWRSECAPQAGGVPVRTSGIVQPPVHAVAALAVLRAARDVAEARSFLRRLYPRLVAQDEYLRRARTVDGLGLAALVHPWESGLDNSPSWDRALHAVPADLDLLRQHQRRDLQHAGADERPTDHDYARYIRLALAYRDSGYRDQTYLPTAEFCVVDPLFNALWAWSEEALAIVAEEIGRDPEPHLWQSAELTERLCRHLFRPDLGLFAAYDVVAGRHAAVRTVGGLVPLVLAGLPNRVVASLHACAVSPAFGVDRPEVAGVPSYDLTAPDWDPRRYWRGPSWLNTTWLVWQGLRRWGSRTLADDLARGTLGAVRQAGFREYFDPRTGAGLGSADFSWSAALAIDLADDLLRGDGQVAGPREE